MADAGVSQVPAALAAPEDTAPSAVPAGLSSSAQDISDPAAVPTQLGPKPLPLTQDMRDYGDYLQAHGANPSEISDYLGYLSSHSQAPEEQESGGFLDNHPSIKNHVQSGINALPMLGQIAGEVTGVGTGILEGLPTGGLASGPLALAQGMAGGAAGGIAGSALKSFLNQTIMGQKLSAGEQLKDMLISGGEGALQAPIGKGLVAGAKMLTPTVGALATGIPADIIQAYMGQNAKVMPEILAAVGGNAAEAATVVQSKIRNAIDSTIGDLELPALKVLKDRVTGRSVAETGNAAIQSLQKEIQTRYAGFPEAYSAIDTVNSALPLKDEARRDLTEGLKSWALENYPQSGETYNLINKHAANFNASNTGAQFRGAMADLNSELSAAYKAGDRTKINALLEVQQRADNFYDQQLKGLAKRVETGTASPEEMSAFQKLNANGPAGPNQGLDPKSIVKDFLGAIDKVNGQYGALKTFLSSVTDQTGVKGFGANTLISNLSKVPPEKLVGQFDKLIDKNVGALASMKRETPEVFNILSEGKIQSLAQDSSANGQLDMTKFHENVMDLPKEVREMMFSPEELKNLSQVASDPRLQRLRGLLKSANKGLTTPGHTESALLQAGRGSGERHLRDLGELSQLTGQNLVSEARAFANAVDERSALEAQQEGVKQLSESTPRDLLTRSTIGAGAAAGLAGAVTGGSPLATKAAGAVGGSLGAFTSPYALKAGIGVLNSAATAPVLGQSVIRGAQGVNAIRQEQQK